MLCSREVYCASLSHQKLVTEAFDRFSHAHMLKPPNLKIAISLSLWDGSIEWTVDLPSMLTVEAKSKV